MLQLAWFARKLGPVIAELLAKIAQELLRHPEEDRARVARDLVRLAEMRSKVIAFDEMMAKIGAEK